MASGARLRPPQSRGCPRGCPAFCHHAGLAIWGIVVASVTLVPVLVLLCSPATVTHQGDFKISARTRTLLLIVLTIAWASIVWFGTITGPFQVTSNGYFACWGGAPRRPPRPAAPPLPSPAPCARLQHLCRLSSQLTAPPLPPLLLQG